MPYDKNIFAKNLKKQMQANDMNSTDIRALLGVSKAAVSDYMNGRAIPRMDKIEVLANKFGISHADLLEDHSEPMPAYDAKTKKIMDMVSQMSEDQKDALLRLFAPDNG